LNAAGWLDILHKNGNFAHFWTHNGKYGLSAWYAIGNEGERRDAFRDLAGGDMYVSVNPSSQIPPCNKSGNTNPRYIAKQAAYIQCLNVLFVEYDGKDYVNPDEYAPFLPDGFDGLSDREKRNAIKIAKECAFYLDVDIYKRRTAWHIEKLCFPPTITVDSGGGYHCYWQLSETVFIEDINRADVVDTQHGWVQMNGGDRGATDISRVLRVLGTHNCKVGFGSNQPLVTIIKYDPNLIYDYADLESAVCDWQAEQRAAGVDIHNALTSVAGQDSAPGLGTIRAMFNRKFSCIELLKRKGYKVCHENKDKAGNLALTRMSRPGKDGVPSVTIFPANDKQPETAVMWSGNDELHSELKHDQDGKSKREGRDAFRIFAALYCDGDNVKAWQQAKRHLGLWK